MRVFGDLCVTDTPSYTDVRGTRSACHKGLSNGHALRGEQRAPAECTEIWH